MILINFFVKTIDIHVFTEQIWKMKDFLTSKIWFIKHVKKKDSQKQYTV